jgi:CRISPR/Cas system CMR-associated protein Cmr1 (group 7 of RAMP superfamily)
VGCVEADRRWWRRTAVAADVLYVSAMKEEEETIHCSKERREGVGCV